jgi:hypothetical protein
VSYHAEFAPICSAILYLALKPVRMIPVQLSKALPSSRSSIRSQGRLPGGNRVGSEITSLSEVFCR